MCICLTWWRQKLMSDTAITTTGYNSSDHTGFFIKPCRCSLRVSQRDEKRRREETVRVGKHFFLLSISTATKHSSPLDVFYRKSIRRRERESGHKCKQRAFQIDHLLWVCAVAFECVSEWNRESACVLIVPTQANAAYVAMAWVKV